MLEWRARDILSVPDPLRSCAGVGSAADGSELMSESGLLRDYCEVTVCA